MLPSCPPPNLQGLSRPPICCVRLEMRNACLQPFDARNAGNRSPLQWQNSGKRCWVQREAKRAAIFQPEFRDDLRFWVKSGRSTALRVLDLVEATMRDPFEGLGKPEALRYLLAGCWSRRITQEHRLVYRVTEEAVDFLQARYHY